MSLDAIVRARQTICLVTGPFDSSKLFRMVNKAFTSLFEEFSDLKCVVQFFGSAEVVSPNFNDFSLRWNTADGVESFGFWCKLGSTNKPFLVYTNQKESGVDAKKTVLWNIAADSFDIGMEVFQALGLDEEALAPQDGGSVEEFTVVAVQEPNELEVLIQNLEEVGALLHSEGFEGWLPWSKNVVRDLRSGKMNAIDEILRSYGGMGSPTDITCSKRIEHLLSQIFALAKSFRR